MGALGELLAKAIAEKTAKSALPKAALFTVGAGAVGAASGLFDPDEAEAGLLGSKLLKAGSAAARRAVESEGSSAVARLAGETMGTPWGEKIIQDVTRKNARTRYLVFHDGSAVEADAKMISQLSARAGSAAQYAKYLESDADTQLQMALKSLSYHYKRAQPGLTADDIKEAYRDYIKNLASGDLKKPYYYSLVEYSDRVSGDSRVFAMPQMYTDYLKKELEGDESFRVIEDFINPGGKWRKPIRSGEEWITPEE